MKRFAIFITLSLLGLNVFAKTWESNVCAGFTVPVSRIGVDKKGVDDITQLCYGLEGFYIGRHENGLTVKGDYAIALTTTRDIHIQDHKTNVGFLTNTSFGAGYSFEPADKWLISITGMFGADVSIFKDSDDDVEYNYSNVEDKKADYDRTLSLITLNFGADFFVRHTMGEHFGVFTNLSARYIIGGWGEDEASYSYHTSRVDRTDKKTDHTDLFGYFRVQPTIGVCWTF
ncbi:hypothetical protein [Treponema ruminis]|uniref:Outer membrane protein beta-barrel domain-containing protein n=1 Tax=Treponema ruminis TaxID=744515 RepID=A0A7W8LL39_9SPIR|nr:hypothetical protein [Treponema ruminis]MBB5224945.1 hypothetical protein [Treponema ruminis]